MPRFRNAVGPQIAKERMALGLTQDQLAARLQRAGLETIDRLGVVKIERRIRSVFDFELRILADVLKTDTDSLFPARETLRSELPDLRKGQRSTRAK